VRELVVNRLDVGDADPLLYLNPVGSFAQNSTETLKLRNGVVRTAGIEPRGYEVRTAFARTSIIYRYFSSYIFTEETALKLAS